MELSSTSLDIDEYLNQGEEGNVINDEPEYAGITATWLRNAIKILSKVATLNSHKKFKSAVKIQSHFRGWMMKKKIASWNQAAINIQKTWRGFIGRSKYFQILESTIRKRIIEHHNKCATIIQSTYRGYHSRKFSHDHFKLKQLQLKATSELLECVALKTRKLFKCHHLPGIYSLRNSRCLGKLENLLALLQVKTYNEEVRKARIAEISKLNVATKNSLRNKDNIQIPFGTCERTTIEAPQRL